MEENKVDEFLTEKFIKQRKVYERSLLHAARIDDDPSFNDEQRRLLKKRLFDGGFSPGAGDEDVDPYYRRKMDNDFNRYLMNENEGREPNNEPTFLKTDKFYNAISRDNAISVMDGPGDRNKVKFASDLVPELNIKRLRIENRDYNDRMVFLKDLKGKLTDKER